MRYLKLGGSELIVSNVCLGTMTWGSQNSEEEAHQQLDTFIELGGTFIDTAGELV
jgi:aryl-alcohol dehydrogenase-like predicted oxidoreductase